MKRATDCLLAFVAAEQADKVTVSLRYLLPSFHIALLKPCIHVQAALVEAFGNKVPKVVVGALDATLLCVRYESVIKALQMMRQSAKLSK